MSYFDRPDKLTNCGFWNREPAYEVKPDPCAGLPSPAHSFDAEVWAKSFVDHVRAKPSIATDEATMLAWFATALQRGYDEAKSIAAIDRAREESAQGAEAQKPK